MAKLSVFIPPLGSFQDTRNVLAGVVQKVADYLASAPPVTDFQQNRLTNLANPVNPQDAVTLSYLQGVTGAPAPTGAGVNLFKLPTTRSYNNIPLAGVGLVPVVGVVALTNQSGSVGTTSISVGGGVAPSGVYRVSTYLWTTTASGTDTVTVSIVYNDGTASHTTQVGPSISLSTTGANGVSSATLVIQADGSNNIQYLTTKTGSTGSPKYALDVVLEKLT